MPQWVRTPAIAAAPIAALMLLAPASRADIDTTGRWVIRGFLIIQPYVVAEDWTQTGTAVTTSSGYSGTISPTTGMFSMTRPPSMFPCGTDTRSGTVSADGLSLTGSEHIHPLFTPTTCIMGTTMSITGSRCPSGTIEVGEGCDDGNSVNGDGCDSNCDVEPCWSCSGTPSVCTPLPAGTSCGDADGIECTVDGTCDAAQNCIETPDSSLCDDHNACSIDVCDPIVGGCVYQGNPCDDGNPCTSDGCLGDCVHDPIIRFDCRTAMSSKLLLKDGVDHRDNLLWKWTRGQSTSQTEFADPTTNAIYTFCVFAGTTNAVVAAAELPPDASHWQPTPEGFIYLDPSAAVDGIARVKLIGNAEDRAKIILKGRAAALDIAAPPFDLPITTQLMNYQSNVCWTATYDPADVRRNEAGTLSVKAIGP